MIFRWLFVQAKDKRHQEELYDKYLGKFRPYKSEILGMAPANSVSIPKLVDILGERDLENMAGFTSGAVDINSLTYSQQLLDIMELSSQPPHMAENATGGGIRAPPGAAFPFCHYGKENSFTSGNFSSRVTFPAELLF